MLIFSIKYACSISNSDSSVNVARTFKCYISRYKLVSPLYNKTYLSVVALRYMKSNRQTAQICFFWRGAVVIYTLVFFSG